MGRLLLPGELVHHRDEDKTNNDISNLEVKTRAQHSREHQIERTEYTTAECAMCGGEFTRRTKVYERQRLRNRSGAVTCSRSCGRKLGAAVGFEPT